MDKFPRCPVPQFPQGVGFAHSWMWVPWKENWGGRLAFPGPPVLQACSPTPGPAHTERGGERSSRQPQGRRASGATPVAAARWRQRAAALGFANVGGAAQHHVSQCLKKRTFRALFPARRRLPLVNAADRLAVPSTRSRERAKPDMSSVFRALGCRRALVGSGWLRSIQAVGIDRRCGRSWERSAPGLRRRVAGPARRGRENLPHSETPSLPGLLRIVATSDPWRLSYGKRGWRNRGIFPFI